MRAEGPLCDLCVFVLGILRGVITFGAMGKHDKERAGRELDALVSQKIMGTPVCTCKICRDTGPDGVCEDCSKPRGRFFSTQSDRALTMLEHLANYNQMVYRVERTADGEGRALYTVSLSTTAKKAISRGTGPTLALAACRAALNTL